MKLLILLLSFFIGCGHSNDDNFSIQYQDMQGDNEKCIVVYNANSASGTPPIDTNIYSINDTVIVMPHNNLYKEGCFFIGWSRYPNCAQPILKAGSTFTITTSTMLYACFFSAPVYSVIYYPGDADGGTPPIDSNYYINGESAYILANTGNLYKTGYRFSGWMFTGYHYLPGQSITIGNADVELYPHFTPKPFIVTYHANGATTGTVPMDTLYYEQGELVTIAHNTGNLVIINRDGVSFCFDHWNDMPDSSGNKYYPGKTYPITQSLQLYASYRPFAIGDTGPAGGCVFYDKGDYSGGWRYLEAMKSDISTSGIVWEQQLQVGQYRQTGATATGIGTGYMNTAIIIQILGEGRYSAKVCASANEGNYNDWFLPSKDELQLLFQSKVMIGKFTNFNYWSSSESSASRAWCQNFKTGAQSIQYKNSTYRVRAIRQF